MKLNLQAKIRAQIEQFLVAIARESPLQDEQTDNNSKRKNNEEKQRDNEKRSHKNEEGLTILRFLRHNIHGKEASYEEGGAARQNYVTIQFHPFL